jgi:hypothetical protein
MKMDENILMMLCDLADKPENKDLFPNPVSAFVKVGETQMENT